jgi:2-polyprenyl-3-methyl-5-hydroxy-6-metoxy-1,4-benzoquinol methylase
MGMTSTVCPTLDGIAEKLEVCPLCGETEFKKLPTPGHWIGKDVFDSGDGIFGLCRCQSCSLAFVNPRPTQELLNAFYLSETYVCHSPEAGNARAAEFLLDRVAHYGPYQGKRFLDFGCGGGFLLRGAAAQWNAFGYDVGQRALASCQAQGLTATDNLNDFDSSSFDVVFLNHVFEHIAEQPDILRTCRRLLGKRGKLFIAVPNLAGMRARLSFHFLSRHFNIDERCRAFPIHLFYFTPRTLTQMLDKNGLHVVALETFGFGMDEFVNRPDPTLTDKVATVRTNKHRTLKQIAKKTFFTAGLGENLLAIARPK